jgi:hypothetical protein
MAESVEELTIEYTEDDIVTVKELAKVVLTKGAWATVMFRYQDWDRTKSEYSPEKYAIRRYQKRDGQYQMRSKFVFSSADQARQIIETLELWLNDKPA